MKDREKIVEAVARGLYKSRNWDDPDPEKRPGDKMKYVWRDLARTALSSLEAELSARGLAILPVEATTEMELAAIHRNDVSEHSLYFGIYRAMTAAYLREE